MVGSCRASLRVPVPHARRPRPTRRQTFVFRLARFHPQRGREERSAKHLTRTFANRPTVVTRSPHLSWAIRAVSASARRTDKHGFNAAVSLHLKQQRYGATVTHSIQCRDLQSSASRSALSYVRRPVTTRCVVGPWSHSLIASPALPYYPPRRYQCAIAPRQGVQVRCR